MKKVAVLVDGGFYRKRIMSIYGSCTAGYMADRLFRHCLKHTKDGNTGRCDLYRIFYYDCPPVNKKVFHPWYNKTIDLGKEPVYEWMRTFLTKLKAKRKVAHYGHR